MTRFLMAAGAAAVLMCAANTAHAEKRLFIVASDGDGYGVDRCLSSGAACGQSVANAYCKSRDFARAQSFHPVDRDDITGAIPTSGQGACKHGSCDNYVAIECSR